MYIIYTKLLDMWHWHIPKILFTVRLSIIILLGSIIQANGSSRAQTISIHKSDATIVEILLDIRKQTDYDFLYSKPQLANAKKVSINLKNASITEVLDKCFDKQPFTYIIHNKIITIKPKEASLFENIVNKFGGVTITGFVIDTLGNPLVGATVKLQGSKILTRTAEKGLFRIETEEDNGVLIIAYLGFKTEELRFNISTALPLKAILKEDENYLKEVLVVSTGYQTIPKETATGSFSQIDNKTINRAVSPDLLSRLKGVTNGLLFDNSTGNATGISVRGRSTIFSNTTPLIVVDNFPFEGDLATLNPDIIENVTILKDAAAASIWGVRAGNGVIVITTKKGNLNSTPKVAINANLTIGEKPDLYYQQQLSSSQYIDIEKFLFDKGLYTATINNGYATISPVIAVLQKIKLDPNYLSQGNAEIETLRNIDNRTQLSEYFYRKNTLQHYSADVMGGRKNQSYYFSAGYDKNITNLVSQSDDRITLNGNNSYSLLNDRLKLNTDVAFSKSKSSNNQTGGYVPYLPYEQIADNNGNSLATLRSGGFRSIYTDTAGKGRLLDWKYRPIDELTNKTNTQVRELTDYRLNVGLNYKIVKALSLSVNYQYYNANSKTENNYNRDSYYVRNMVNSVSSVNSTTGVVTRPIAYGGIYSPSFNLRESNYGRAQLNFNETFSKRHEISAIAGYEMRDDESKINYYTVYGYRPETGTGSIVDLINQYPYYYNPASGTRISGSTAQGGNSDRYVSIYGNASYIFDGKYVISGSYRKDESNLFGVKANQKGVPLWSTGLAWNIHKEDFFDLHWLSSLQLKATYGYNGNVNNSISAYLTASSSFFNPYGVQGFIIVNPPNDNLRWERVKNTNFGLYFSSFKSRITGSLEYYVKDGIDLIGRSPIAPQTGISLFTGNTADTHATGIDIQLNSRNIDNEFKWGTTIIFNYVKDKITDYKVESGTNLNILAASTNNLSPLVGYPVNSVFGYKWAGLDASGNPQGYVNDAISTDYTTIINSSDRTQLQFFGSATPTVFGSLRNTFSYKSLELSFNIMYKMNYYFRRQSLDYGSLFLGQYAQPDYEKRWQKAGDELSTNVPALVYPNVSGRGDFYNNSAILVERGDHIRFQDIQINYSFSKPHSKSPLSNINIYAYLNNLGILWRANKQGLDPDVRFGYPNPRTVAFGLKTNF